MESVLNDIYSPKTNIDIIGNIFICDELCDLNINYKDHNLISIINQNVTLEIIYNNKSCITYNGGEEFGSQQIKYTLKKILLLGPSKHFIQSYRRNSQDNMGAELILVHMSEDGKRFQNIAIRLYISDSCASKKKVQYKLFNEIADNIPTKKEKVKRINIESWSVEDFLPDNKTFYTYNSPFNTTINWIVFKEEVCVPSKLIDNYFKYVLDPDQKQSELLRNAPIPDNPKNLIIFGHKIIQNIQTGCAKKMEEKVSAEQNAKHGEAVFEDKFKKEEQKEKQKFEDKKETIDGDKETEKKEEKGTTEEDKKEEDKKEEDKKEEDKKEEDKKEEKEEEKKGLSWWQWILIIILILLVIYLVSSSILYWLYGDTQNIYLQYYYWPINKIIGVYKEYYNNNNKLSPDIELGLITGNNSNKAVNKVLTHPNIINNKGKAQDLVNRIISNKKQIKPETLIKLAKSGVLDSNTLQQLRNNNLSMALSNNQSRNLANMTKPVVKISKPVVKISPENIEMEDVSKLSKSLQQSLAETK